MIIIYVKKERKKENERTYMDKTIIAYLSTCHNMTASQIRYFILFTIFLVFKNIYVLDWRRNAEKSLVLILLIKVEQNMSGQCFHPTLSFIHIFTSNSIIKVLYLAIHANYSHHCEKSAVFEKILFSRLGGFRKTDVSS